MSVNLISYPPNFASALCGALLYRYNGGTSDSAVVTVINEKDSAAAGSKSILKNTLPCSINAAPIVLSLFDPAPVCGNQTGFMVNDGLGVSVKLLCGTQYSPSRFFTLGRKPSIQGGMLSSMPCVGRDISVDERAEISFALGSSDRLSCELTLRCGSGTETTFDYTHHEPQYHICTFLLDMQEIISLAKLKTPDIRRPECLTLSFRLDGEILAKLTYDMAVRSENAVRLAWLNDMGAIEYHTFDRILDITRERGSVHSPGTLSIRSFAEADTILTLSAGVCSRRESEALAGLIVSPKVWRIASGGCYPVEVATSKVNIMSDTPEPFMVSIRETGQKHTIQL